MGDVSVAVEWEYCQLDTREWFAATAEDVSDYWMAIIERVATGMGDEDGRDFYSSSSVTTWQLCEARDRVIEAIRKRSAKTRYHGTGDTWAGHTYNHETNFETNFGWTAVEHTRAGYDAGVLVFVSMGEHFDGGADYVLHFDTWDETYSFMSPRIGYYCDEDHERGETTNGGCSFETYAADGEYLTDRRDVIADGVAKCSHGHVVTLHADTYIGG